MLFAVCQWDQCSKSTGAKAVLRTLVKLTPTYSRFHKCFPYRFYVCRSKKRKNSVKLSASARKMLMKLIPNGENGMPVKKWGENFVILKEFCKFHWLSLCLISSLYGLLSIMLDIFTLDFKLYECDWKSAVFKTLSYHLQQGSQTQSDLRVLWDSK